MCSSFSAKFGEILSLLFLKILETCVRKSGRASVKLHSHAEDSFSLLGSSALFSRKQDGERGEKRLLDKKLT